MRHRQPAQLSNPLFGTYFSIFAAILVALILAMLILEQLGTARASLGFSMAAVCLGLFVVIGMGAYTARSSEFLVAARRIPAVFNGLSIMVTTLGGAGLAGLTGSLFISGFDLLFIGLGAVAGLVASVLLIAPFLRKFGAPTVPGYFGARFESGFLRILSAVVSVVVLLLLALAEFKMAMQALSWMVPVPPTSAAITIAVLLILTIVPGGVRSQSWSSAAQALAMMAAVIVPASIAAVIETSLPFSQLTHGPILRAVGRAEPAHGLPVVIAGLLDVDIPGSGLQAIDARFANAFGNVGQLAFPLAVLSVLAGIAAAPGLLSRALATPTIYDTRKSIGWAVALVALLVTTLAAIAVFERHLILTQLNGATPAVFGQMLRQLGEMGLVDSAGAGTRLTLTGLRFDRDGALVALPVLLGLPRVLVDLAALGVLAAALAALGLSITQIGIIVGEDVILAPRSFLLSDGARLLTMRVCMVVAVAMLAAASIMVAADPLALMLHATAITGAAVFPALVFSIWWKRTTATAAAAAIAIGFALAIAMVLGADVGLHSVPVILAPVLALPFAALTVPLVSHLTPVPPRHILEKVRDLRIPGGETVYGREVRQARQRTSPGRT